MQLVRGGGGRGALLICLLASPVPDPPAEQRPTRAAPPPRRAQTHSPATPAGSGPSAAPRIPQRRKRQVASAGGGRKAGKGLPSPPPGPRAPLTSASSSAGGSQRPPGVPRTGPAPPPGLSQRPPPAGLLTAAPHPHPLSRCRRPARDTYPARRPAPPPAIPRSQPRSAEPARPPPDWRTVLSREGPTRGFPFQQASLRRNRRREEKGIGKSIRADGLAKPLGARVAIGCGGTGARRRAGREARGGCFDSIGSLSRHALWPLVAGGGWAEELSPQRGTGEDGAPLPPWEPTSSDPATSIVT